MFLKKEKTLYFFSTIIFILYLLFMIWVIMFKCNLIDSITKSYEFFYDMSIKERFNAFIVPFKNVFPESIDAPSYLFNSDDIFNIIIFLPFGMYLSFFIKKLKLVKVIIISFITCLFFELFQLFTLIGSFAVQDFITNVFGAILGYFVYKLIFIKGLGNKKKIVLNILSIIAILILVPIVLYAIVNTFKYIDFYKIIITRKLIVNYL